MPSCPLLGKSCEPEAKEKTRPAEVSTKACSRPDEIDVTLSFQPKFEGVRVRYEMLFEKEPQKGIQDPDCGLSPAICSACETGIEYTSPDLESAMIRSREMAREVRFFPLSVVVGCVVSVEKAVPHCNRSPFSSIAAAKFLSSLISRSRTLSKKGILRGVLIKASDESGATTLPELDPHAYTPGFSQLFFTCKCCELMMFLLSSSDWGRLLGFSKVRSDNSVVSIVLGPAGRELRE